MAQIESIDWEAKRFYLHADTVANGFDAWEAYAEVRDLVAINAGGEQNYRLFLQRVGNIPKGGGAFTPRYVSFLAGWRAVPYDQTPHKLELTVEMLSDDTLSDAEMFDRSGVTVNVDIDAVYSPNEIREVTSGSAVLPSDVDAIKSAVWAAVLEDTETATDMMRLFRATLVGKATGANTTEMAFRSADDSKARITATVDEFGNRSAVTTDPS